jgi:hypothetical protein
MPSKHHLLRSKSTRAASAGGSQGRKPTRGSGANKIGLEDTVAAANVVTARSHAAFVNLSPTRVIKPVGFPQNPQGSLPPGRSSSTLVPIQNYPTVRLFIAANVLRTQIYHLLLLDNQIYPVLRCATAVSSTNYSTFGHPPKTNTCSQHSIEALYMYSSHRNTSRHHLPPELHAFRIVRRPDRRHHGTNG